MNRWFPAESLSPEDWPVAKFLDIILYSKAQVLLENSEMSGPGGNLKEKELEDWLIVAIKAQDEKYETPMTPITMMRNALGRDEGGSGVELDRQKYKESVEYWSDRAIVAQ